MLFGCAKKSSENNDALDYSTWIPNLVSYEDQLTFMQQKFDEIWYNNADPAAVLAEIETGINGILQE